MLELIFQGFVEWIYGLILEAWEYFSNVLLDIMSLDFAYLRSHMPIIDTIMQIILAVGWALFIGNLVFQAVKSMATGLGFEAEDPRLLFTRSFAFAFLLLASPQICRLCLDMTSTIIEILQVPDAVDITFADDASFGGLAASWLLVVICGIIVMFQTFKLIMEMAERYFILSLLTISAPMAFAMGGSRNTSDIFTGWCRMFGSMCVLMVTNVVFVKMLLSALSFYPSGLDVLPWMVLIVTIVKVAKKADSILSRIGLNPALTGDPLGRSFPGMLAYTVVRSMASNVARTVGRSGRGGASTAQSGNPNGPRPTAPAGGAYTGSSSSTASTKNQSSSQSSSAQQTNVRPGAQQEACNPQPAQQVSSQQETQSQSAASSFAASQSQQTGTATHSSRNTSVPPGTRRAPSHVPSANGVNVKSADRSAPTTPSHRAEAAAPMMRGAVMQNTHQEHTNAQADLQNSFHAPARDRASAGSEKQAQPRSAAPQMGGTHPAFMRNMEGASTQKNGAAENRSAPTQAQSSVPSSAGAGIPPVHPTRGTEKATMPPASSGTGSASQQPNSPTARSGTAGTVPASNGNARPDPAPQPGSAGTPRTSIGGRYTQPVQQTTRISASENTQVTQHNRTSSQQVAGAAQPSGNSRADGRSTNRERSTPTAPVSPMASSAGRETAARPDAAHPISERRASQRPAAAQNSGAGKPAPRTASSQLSPAHGNAGASSERQSRTPATVTPSGNVPALASVRQKSRTAENRTASAPYAKRPAAQEQKPPQTPALEKKEAASYLHPGAAGIAPTAAGMNEKKPSAAQKAATEQGMKKPFVPLKGRTPESIPTHLDLKQEPQKSTRRPDQEEARHGTE